MSFHHTTTPPSASIPTLMTPTTLGTLGTTETATPHHHSETSPFAKYGASSPDQQDKGATQAHEHPSSNKHDTGAAEAAEGDLGVHGGETVLVTGSISNPLASASAQGDQNGRRGEQGTKGAPHDLGVQGYNEWEAEYERQRSRGWQEKVDADLLGWRGGNGSPRSSYPRQALPPQTYYHQPITGTIGKHLPKEIVRVERDWSGGEVCQFESGFPMELEGRIQPSEFTSFINTLNAILASAYGTTPAILDNLIAIATLWTSLIWRQSHFDKELQRAENFIDQVNKELFNPKGLQVLSPRYVALQFLEIE